MSFDDARRAARAIQGVSFTMAIERLDEIAPQWRERYGLPVAITYDGRPFRLVRVEWDADDPALVTCAMLEQPSDIYAVD